MHADRLAIGSAMPNAPGLGRRRAPGGSGTNPIVPRRRLVIRGA